MGYLDKLDLDKKLQSKEEYEELLEEYQLRLLKLQRKIIEKGIPVSVAYEGEDAAGKGGNIKRLTEALDPRGYEVCPIGAPPRGTRPTTGCVAFGSGSRPAAASGFLIAPGMAGFWSSASRSLPRRRNGSALTGRSMNSSGPWWMAAWSW